MIFALLLAFKSERSKRKRRRDSVYTEPTSPMLIKAGGGEVTPLHRF